MNNQKSKIQVEIEKVEEEVFRTHRDYIEMLKAARNALDREIKGHTAGHSETDIDKIMMPSTTMAGELFCDEMRHPRRASDKMTELRHKLSLLNHLVRD